MTCNAYTFIERLLNEAWNANGKGEGGRRINSNHLHWILQVYWNDRSLISVNLTKERSAIITGSMISSNNDNDTETETMILKPTI